VTRPFFTIGHSTRSLDAFVALIREVEINLVADIRKVARSGTNPQFNEDTLRDDLTAFGLSYEHFAALGGLRAGTKGLFRPVSRICGKKGVAGFARSCAPKRCGAAAIAAS
jgi:hypothetical protein